MNAATTETLLNKGKAWALLVGVNKYEDPHIPSLSVCVNDVTAIHKLLAEQYQAANLLTDNTLPTLPTRANILGELANLSDLAYEDDLILFYFSGHGFLEGGESYLLPSDTRRSAITHTAIGMNVVHKLINSSAARAKIIILDACHSGANIGKEIPRMPEEFFIRVFEKAEGTAILCSCKQGQLSYEWKEKKTSVFTYHLLEALRGRADYDGKGFVTVSDTNRYVVDGVKQWSAANGTTQTPTLKYEVAGDINLLNTGNHKLKREGSKSDPEKPRGNPMNLDMLRADFQRRMELVNTMLQCANMSDRDVKDAIVNEMPTDIRNNIRRSTIPRVDAMNIIKTSLSYENGLETLIETLRSYEGNSIEMKRVDELIDRFHSLLE